MMTQVEEYIWEQHRKIFDKQLAEVEEENSKKMEELTADMARESRANNKKIRAEKRKTKA